MKNFWLYAIFLLFLSGCSTQIHKDFLQNFTESQKTNGARPRVVVSLAYNDFEKYLLVGHESGSIEIWDAKKSKSMREIKAHDHRANLIAFSFDGKVFFTNSYFENSTKLWDTRSGDLICVINDTKGPVSPTSDNRYFLIANNSKIRVFDYRNKILLPEQIDLAGDVVTAIAYNLISDQFAIGTASGNIQILKFSIKDGRPMVDKSSKAYPYSMGNWVVGLSFSDNGKTLYSVAKYGSINEWSTQPLENRRSLPTTLHGVSSVSFSPDKGLLALSGRDKAAYPSMGKGFVEIHTLSSGKYWSSKLTTDYPGPIEFLYPLGSLISAESYSMENYALPQEH